MKELKKKQQNVNDTKIYYNCQKIKDKYLFNIDKNIIKLEKNALL